MFNINHNDDYYDTREDLDSVDDSTSFDLEQTKQTCFQRFRNICGAFVNDDGVQLIIVWLIAINALMMGLATFDFVSENEEVNAAFELTDFIFLVIFTVELGLQFIYHGIYLIMDGWLVFDLVIITLSWGFSSMQIIRSFRIFRALRLIGRVKVMRHVVTAILNVIPKMIAIGWLLMLVEYIFSVMFTTLFKELYAEELTSWDYFTTLEASAFTLFQVLTLDNWSDICREVQQKYSWAWVLFFLYIIISGFIGFNLIIAVVCEAVSSLNKNEKKKEAQEAELAESVSDKDKGNVSVVQENKIPLRDAISDIEQRIAFLERSQERTMNTIDYVTRRLRISKTMPGQRL